VDATGWRPLVDAGKLRLLMIWTAKRSPNYPDVPTCRRAEWRIAHHGITKLLRAAGEIRHGAELQEH
jgi:hypothetical protein